MQFGKKIAKKVLDFNRQVWHNTCMKFKTNTSLFSHVSFWILVVSLGYLHTTPDSWFPTAAVYGVWVTAMIFHRIRRIDDLEFDLDDKSIKIGTHNDKP